MKKRWLFPLIIVVLLFSFGVTCVDSNGAIQGQEIRAKVTEKPAQPAWSNGSSNTGSSENTTSANRTITLKNPTFREVKDFILKDPTSRNQFILYKYECRHFATDVDNNANAAGLNCGFALLCYDRGQHAVVAFDTTDRGLIFIEPQTDAAIDVEIGGTYQNQQIKEILIAW
jgi:hypothetical protein